MSFFSYWMQSLRAPLLVLGVVCLSSPGVAVEPSTDHDVVIVGAGAAGLYAAYTLDNLGYDVLLLEATGRHGGRVYSDTLGDVGIEHGAESLYGTANNFIYGDINSYYGSGSQIRIFRANSSQDQLIVMDADGAGGGSPCWSETGNCYLDPDIDDYWDFYYQIGDHDNSATDPLVSDFLASDWGVTSSSRGYHLYDAATPGGSYGTTVERLGLRSLSREWNTFSLSGSLYGLNPVGYLEALNTLYFNQVIPRISYNSPVTVVDTSGTKPVAIDANGVWHYADAIVVTVSVGVLKSGIIDFIPDLPMSKMVAIGTIGMGKGMKMSLRFSSQIWQNKLMEVVLDGPTGLCWTPNQYQPSASDHVLTCFYMGVNAEFMGSLADDNARISQALTDLDAAFGGAATPAFVEGVVTDWTSNPYVRGSYSFPSPGTRPLSGLTQRQVLAQPVGSALYFAGEATHNTAAATVPGAMQSGERAGGEVDGTLGGAPAAGTPTADFSASVTSGSAPLEVTFSDLSSEIPTSWSWDFGDAGVSTDENPVHEYATPGDYTVSLTATNANGSHTRVLPLLVTVPEPSMAASLMSGLMGLFVIRARRKQTARRG